MNFKDEDAQLMMEALQRANETQGFGRDRAGQVQQRRGDMVTGDDSDLSPAGREYELNKSRQKILSGWYLPTELNDYIRGYYHQEDIDKMKTGEFPQEELVDYFIQQIVSQHFPDYFTDPEWAGKLKARIEELLQKYHTGEEPWPNSRFYEVTKVEDEVEEVAGAVVRGTGKAVGAVARGVGAALKGAGAVAQGAGKAVAGGSKWAGDKLDKRRDRKKAADWEDKQTKKRRDELKKDLGNQWK